MPPLNPLPGLKEAFEMDFTDALAEFGWVPGALRVMQHILVGRFDSSVRFTRLLAIPSAV